ncbi:MAG: hypothetical protein H6703_16410 [Myxococcales bacterium]|nr:hypothetical protein [Myxococcales bacterium]
MVRRAGVSWRPHPATRAGAGAAGGGAAAAAAGWRWRDGGAGGRRRRGRLRGRAGLNGNPGLSAIGVVVTGRVPWSSTTW